MSQPQVTTSKCNSDHTKESAANHVHIGNGASSDSDGDDDNTDLEFPFYTKDQDGKEQTSDTWVLLDNQSTVDVFFNESLLENICDSVSSLDLHCNAGMATVNKVGDFPGYGTVWFHPGGIANILSLARVKEKNRVTFDSLKGNQFVVHKGDGSYQVFVESNQIGRASCRERV